MTIDESSPHPKLSLQRRLLVMAMLAVSCASNILVLFLPFMDLRKGISTEPYSLFRSVHMLWNSGLIVLAVLVVAFSIIFPFAKLGVLAWVTASSTINDRQRTWLHWVEKLGKWSMLDVFLVAIILALTSRQIFVGAEPLIGLPLFILAICLSMLAGEVLSAALNEKVEIEEVTAARHGGWWLACSGLALVATITLPLLRIHDWRMLDHSYSILFIIPVLWLEGARIPSVLAALFLVLAPIAVWIASAVAWWQQTRGRLGHAHIRWLPLAHRWSMLDVFGLAFTVFALESESLMRTETRWGALALAATLVLQRAFQTVFEHVRK